MPLQSNTKRTRQSNARQHVPARARGSTNATDATRQPRLQGANYRQPNRQSAQLKRAMRPCARVRVCASMCKRTTRVAVRTGCARTWALSLSWSACHRAHAHSRQQGASTQARARACALQRLRSGCACRTWLPPMATHWQSKRAEGAAMMAIVGRNASGSGSFQKHTCFPRPRHTPQAHVARVAPSVTHATPPHVASNRRSGRRSSHAGLAVSAVSQGSLAPPPTYSVDGCREHKEVKEQADVKEGLDPGAHAQRPPRA